MKRPAGAPLARPAASGEQRFLLVSSYTEKLGHIKSKSCPHAEGLCVFRVHEQAAGIRLELQEKLQIGSNPTYMCTNRAFTLVYICCETYDSDEAGNLLLAYSFNGRTGQLQLLNSVEVTGRAACHVALSRDESHLAVVTYLGGSVAMFKLEANGAIGDRTGYAHDLGSGAMVNAERQERPHPHMVSFSLSGSWLFVPDLGLDKVLSFDCAAGLDKGPALEMQCPPGSGPRHLVLHPSGRWCYVLCELLSIVISCSVEGGKLAPLAESISAVPEGTKVGVDGESFSAAIRISSDGRFVYVSNRGHDSIALFLVNSDGILERPPAPQVPTYLTGGGDGKSESHARCATPRDFALCGEEDTWLVVGNQDSDCLVAFARGTTFGELKELSSADCPAPACILPMW